MASSAGLAGSRLSLIALHRGGCGLWSSRNLVSSLQRTARAHAALCCVGIPLSAEV
jgi:hypothetical protein